jgi:heme exporter protein D
MTMSRKATWDDLTQVVRGLADRQVGPPVTGTFSIKSETDLSVIRACLAAQHDTNLQLVNGEDPSTLRIGHTVKVSVSPRLGFGLLKQDIDDLLAGARKARIKEPSFFLMTEEISDKDVVDGDHAVARYRTALQVIHMLKQSAAFLDADEPALVFIKDGKFEVPIKYDGDVLKRMHLSTMKEVLNLIPAGTHEKQCASILADAVIAITEHVPSEQRFSYLLTHAGDLKKKFDQGYQLFAAGFSYEKVRDEVEAARVEYSGKIHKVFSEIQNQLLGIPVATIVVATQMKDAAIVGYAFWVNTAVLVGCWVFAILMVFLLHNQSHTLAVLRDEIRRQKRQLLKEYSAVADSFTETFDYLSKRAGTQRAILWTINGFVLAGLVFSHVIYLKLTPPARDWAVGCFPSLGRWF